jgi:hypothetical protein
VLEGSEGEEDAGDVRQTDPASIGFDGGQEEGHRAHERAPRDSTRERRRRPAVSALFGDADQGLGRTGRHRSVDREDEREETTTDEVEREGDNPQANERPEQPGAGSFDRRRGRAEEVLVEQLGPAHDEKHESDPEGERARERGDRSELRFDDGLNDAESDDAEDDGEPGDKTGRDQFEEGLIESSFPFVDGSIENLGR